MSNCGRKKEELGKMVEKPRLARTVFLMKRIFCRKEVERGKLEDNFATRESEMRVRIRYNGTCFGRVSIKIPSVPYFIDI